MSKIKLTTELVCFFVCASKIFASHTGPHKISKWTLGDFSALSRSIERSIIMGKTKGVYNYSVDNYNINWSVFDEKLHDRWEPFNSEY